MVSVELIGGVRSGAQFHSYIAHRKECFPLALQCHGLDPKFLSDKPPPSFVIPSFVRWVDGAVLCGHNVAFDLRMLNGKLTRCPSRPPFEGLWLPDAMGGLEAGQG